jgi:PST family polysaccharide transporter
VTGFNIFNYFARNADYLLIGRFLGAQELGYYTLAYRILLFPIQNISSVIGRVMYPVFSSLQEDNKQFASAYLKVIANIALVTFPLMFGVIALARPFVLTFFGENWEPVILLVIIFAPVGLAQSIGTTVGSIYQAKGRADWMFRWGIVSGTLVVTSFVVGLQWGIIGVAVAYTIAALVLFFPSFAIPFSLIDMKFNQMIRVLKPLFFNSGLMFIALILFIQELPSSLSEVIVLAVSTIVGITIYGLVSWFTNRDQLRTLWILSGLGKRKLNEAE